MVAKIQPANIREGQPVTLTCSAKGNPDPSFTWFKNDTEIVYSGAQTWQIASINDSQSGEYHCVAENKHGKLPSKRLTINVKCKYFLCFYSNSFNLVCFCFSVVSTPVSLLYTAETKIFVKM